MVEVEEEVEAAAHRPLGDLRKLCPLGGRGQDTSVLAGIWALANPKQGAEPSWHIIHSGEGEEWPSDRAAVDMQASTPPPPHIFSPNDLHSCSHVHTYLTQAISRVIKRALQAGGKAGQQGKCAGVR